MAAAVSPGFCCRIAGISLKTLSLYAGLDYSARILRHGRVGVLPRTRVRPGKTGRPIVRSCSGESVVPAGGWSSVLT